MTIGALRRLEKSAGAFVAAGAAGGALETAGAGLGVAATFFSTDGAAGFIAAGAGAFPVDTSGVLAWADTLLGGGVTDGDAGATRGGSSFAALGAGASAGFWLAG